MTTSLAVAGFYRAILRLTLRRDRADFDGHKTHVSAIFLEPISWMLIRQAPPRHCSRRR